MKDLLPWFGTLGGITVLLQLAYGAWRDRHGGVLRKGQAEAAKASLDVSQAEQSLPHVEESLRLGNFTEAISLQQQVINGLREHATWQDAQLELRDQRIADLERRLTERDRKIAELERRLDEAEASLNTAKRLITELRATSRSERRDTSQ